MKTPIPLKPPWADVSGPAPDGAGFGTAPGPEPGAPATPSGQGLLEPAYAAAYTAYSRNPDPANATHLLNTLKPVMGEALKSYAGGEAASPTVVAHAKRLTLEAVKRYDPSQAKLRTHLLSHLRGIRRHVARSTSPIYYPEAHRMDAVRLTAVTNDLVDKLGRDPSDAEIADASGMDLRRISSARGVTGALAGGQVGDVVSVGARRDPAAWDNWLKIVYHDLDPVDQLILEHSFGMHGKPVLPANEIAGRVGLSGGAVSQRKARIQNVLDEYDMFMGHGG